MLSGYVSAVKRFTSFPAGQWAAHLADKATRTPGCLVETETELSCIIRPLSHVNSVLLAAPLRAPFLSVTTIFSLGTLTFFLQTRRVEDGCPYVSATRIHRSVNAGTR
jgi:hypothetical protein